MNRTIAAALTATVAFALSACGGSEAQEPASGHSSKQTGHLETLPGEADTADTGADVSTAAYGSYEEPLPVGSPVMLDAWELTIEPATLSDQRAAGGPPDEVALTATVSAIRVAEEAGFLDEDLSVSVIGGDGVEYSTQLACEGSMDEYADVHPGSEIAGNFCPLLPEDAVPGSVWKIEEWDWNAADVGDTAYIETGM